MYPSEQVAILRVNTKESREAILKALGKNPSKILILLDKNGKVGKLFGVWVHPTSYLIDRHGMVRYRAMGCVDWTGEEARYAINELLKEK